MSTTYETKPYHVINKDWTDKDKDKNQAFMDKDKNINSICEKKTNLQTVIRSSAISI